MRTLYALLGATATVVLTTVGAPSAKATGFGFEINGTYSFLSNGEWARSNDQLHDEPVVRATWQVSSSCESVSVCTGQVTSDQGWTAPMKWSTDRWIVKRELLNWAPCETGGAATGHQTFTFYGIDDRGQVNRNTDFLAGRDTTFTDSGSCGKNLPLNIVIPMRLQRIS